MNTNMEYDYTHIYDIKEYDYIKYFTWGIYLPNSYIPDDYKERVFREGIFIFDGGNYND